MTTRDKVLKYVQSVEHSPTIREIAGHVGVSHSTVAHHLDHLEAEQLIWRYGADRRIYPAKDAA